MILKEIYKVSEAPDKNNLRRLRSRLDKLIGQVHSCCDNRDSMHAGSEIRRLAAEIDITLQQLSQEVMR